MAIIKQMYIIFQNNIKAKIYLLRIKYLKESSYSIYPCSIIHFSSVGSVVQYVPYTHRFLTT